MPKVEVVHVTSPLCHWSWGYEPVMNYLELVYGKQIEITMAQALPYVDRAKWLEDYGMSADEAIQWAKDDILPAIRMPVALPRSWNEMPESCLPATTCVYAASLAHGPKAERRLMRRLMYAAFVEGRDTAEDKVLADIVTQLGYDNDRMVAASQGDAIDRAMENDMRKAGHGGNFYSLIVRDNKGTTISLDKGYDPSRAERAIDWMAGKKLNKKKPKDVLGYVEEHGPVPVEEIVTVFGKAGKDALAKLEKKGDVKRVATPLLPKAKFYERA